MSRLYVYVAGPYTQGDPTENTANAIRAGNALFDLGIYPYIPHMSHFWHAQHPRDYEDWMDLDFAWLERCDMLFRLPGYSPGADREVEHAHRLNIPIFLENGDRMGWHELVSYLADLRGGVLDARTTGWVSPRG